MWGKCTAARPRDCAAVARRESCIGAEASASWGSPEATLEELFDRYSSGVAEASGAGTCHGAAGDGRAWMFHPVVLGPVEPGILILVEDIEVLVHLPGELSGPAGASLHGTIIEDVADHKDLA